MPKVSACYLEKQKGFIFLSRTAKLDPEDGACCPNFQWRFCYVLLHKREGKATIAHIIYYGTSGGELKILEIFKLELVVGNPNFVWCLLKVIYSEKATKLACFFKCF